MSLSIARQISAVQDRAEMTRRIETALHATRQRK